MGQGPSKPTAPEDSDRPSRCKPSSGHARRRIGPSDATSCGGDRTGRKRQVTVLLPPGLRRPQQQNRRAVVASSRRSLPPSTLSLCPGRWFTDVIGTETHSGRLPAHTAF